MAKLCLLPLLTNGTKCLTNSWTHSKNKTKTLESQMTFILPSKKLTDFPAYNVLFVFLHFLNLLHKVQDNSCCIGFSLLRQRRKVWQESRLDQGTYSIILSMVWLMICFTLSISSSSTPCSPILNDASLVLPSYLQDATLVSILHKYMQVMDA